MYEDGTHNTLGTWFQVESLSSFFGGGSSFSGSFGFIFDLFGVLSPPGLRDPASLVEEPPNDDNVVAQDVLGHPHLVDSDVGSGVFHRQTVSRLTATSLEMMRGTITAITTFFSLVSLVAHSRYFSSFSLKASFSLSVDVIFTSTTTFFPFVAGDAPEPHHVWSQLCPRNTAFLFPFVGSPVLCSSRDIVAGTHHCLPVLLQLFVGDQSSLDEDIVEKDVQDHVMPCVDLS